MDILSQRARKRIAKLWGVPPFRVEVEVDLEHRWLRATLDGQVPDASLLDILEKDVQELTQAAIRRMN